VAETLAGLIRSDAHGLVHLTNEGDCSWFEFAGEIFRLSGLTVDLVPITTAEFNAVARRPAYSVLTNARLADFGVPRARPWQSALAAYLDSRSNARP
jgi:dTDP-4-dehydrorhamnose reductase